MDKKIYIYLDLHSFFPPLLKGNLHLCCIGNSLQPVREFCSFSASGGGHVCPICLWFLEMKQAFSNNYFLVTHCCVLYVLY